MTITTAPRPVQARDLVAPRRRKPVTPGRIAATLGTTLLILVVVIPLVWLVMGSFKTQSEFLNSPAFAMPDSWLNFDNYSAAINEGNLGTYARNSVVAVFPSLLLTLL